MFMVNIPTERDPELIYKIFPHAVLFIISGEISLSCF
jgi:hypothetical protein